MANEIWTDYYSGNLIDAYIFKKTDDTVFDEADGGDMFEVWQDGNVLNYDIPMTDQGDGHYTVDFPVVIADDDTQAYRIVVKLRVGANAAVGDTKLGTMEIQWDGEQEIDLGILSISDLTVTNIYSDDSTTVNKGALPQIITIIL